MTLVEGKCEAECAAVFGDHNNPPTPTPSAVLRTRPARDWQGRFVSAYATAHPWEDFAETWGFYFDMWAVLMTMHHHLPALAPIPTHSPSPLARTYQQLGIFFNESTANDGP